jgi:hypothetical protein
MVISIEIPTSIAMPITTAASTESLCNKLIFSYVKFRQRCHKRRNVTTSRNIEQDLRVHTLASQSGAQSAPSVLAAMKSDPGPPDEAPQCGKSRASAGDRSTASVHSPSSPIYLSPSHRRLFAIACLNSIRTAAGERQDVVLDVPGHAPLVRLSPDMGASVGTRVLTKADRCSLAEADNGVTPQTTSVVQISKASGTPTPIVTLGS